MQSFKSLFAALRSPLIFIFAAFLLKHVNKVHQHLFQSSDRFLFRNHDYDWFSFNTVFLALLNYRFLLIERFLCYANERRHLKFLTRLFFPFERLQHSRKDLYTTWRSLPGFLENFEAEFIDVYFCFSLNNRGYCFELLFFLHICARSQFFASLRITRAEILIFFY